MKNLREIVKEKILILDVANVINVLFDGSGESFFLNFREFGEVTNR